MNSQHNHLWPRFHAKTTQSSWLQILCLMLLTGLALAQTINIDPPTRSFTKDGGGGSVLTSGSGTWTAEKNVSWITITPRTTGTAGQSCIYVVNSNFSADTRQGIITLAGKTHTVTQTGYNATLSPTSGTTNLNGSTGSVSVTVDAGVAWSAVSNAEWVTVSPASGTSSGTVTYTVAPYAGVTNRTTSLTIAGKTFSLTQTGTDVNISPKSVEKAYSSDIIQVSVSALATTTWNVTPNASWISVVDPGNKFGDSTITLAIGTNPSFLERTGTVSIGSATFTIQQMGTSNPLLDILPKEATADALGAYGNVAVLATPDASWTAESLSPWIVISQGTSGAGNGNIQYVASANPGLSERIGRIQITPPVFQPNVDLTRGLIGWYQGRDDLTGWERHLENALDDFSFDGRTKVYVNTFGYGDNAYHRADPSFSIGFGFEVTESGATHPLFSIDHGSGNDSAIYVNEQNKLVVAVNGISHVSNHTVNINTMYQVLLTQTSARQTKLYFGTVGNEAFSTSSFNFTLSADFFPTSTTKNKLKFGHSNYPSPGILNGKLRDFRIYNRAIAQVEARAWNQQFSISAYSRYRGIAEARDWVDASACNSRGQGQYLASPETQYEANLLARFGEDSLESKFTSEASNPGSGWDYSIAWVGWRKNQWLQSGFPPFWPNGSINTHSVFSEPYYVISSNGSFDDYPNSMLYYFTETERPSSVTTTVQSSTVETSTTPLYRFEFKGNSLGTTRLPFRLTGVSATTDRLGRAGSALKWNATGGNLTLEGAQAPHTSQNATYAMWLKFDSLPQGDLNLMIRDQTSDRTPNFGIALTNEGKSIKVWVNDDGNKTAIFPISLSTTNYHHLVISASVDNIVKVILDGSEIGNTPLMTGYRFGSWNDSYQSITIHRWNGSLDDLAVYDGALSVSEVRNIYNLEKPRSLIHTVTQGVVQPNLAPASATLPAQGGVATAQLTLPLNVTWTASTSTPWLTILSATDSAGSTTLQVQAEANPTVYQRTGTVTIAQQTFTVTQAGLNANVSYEETVFSTDGGSGWVEVSPEGNAQWQSVSDVAWLTVALGESGVGAGSVFIVADPYTNTSQSRTGSVTIAGKKVYFTQRGYTLSITPQVAQVGSNAGAGEFGVAAPISAVWEAIVTQPWITVVGGSTGLGNGTVRYSLASNTTGQSRTGRIIVSGKEYTITQLASLLVTTQASSGGTVSGGGSFDVNATATLTATASAGFAFSHWTGDAVGSANPLQVTVDSNKSVQANFVPTSATTGFFNNGVQSVVAAPNTYGLYKSEQLRSMAMGTPVLEVNQATGKGKIQFGIKQSQDLNNWSDMNINSADVYIRNGKLEIEFTRTGNAAFYQVIGSETSQ